MNILVTGNLSSIATSFVKEFTKEKNKLILAAKNANPAVHKLNNKVIIHSIDPADNAYIDVLSAYKFDIIIYLSNREEQLMFFGGGEQNVQLSGLKNTLDLCKGLKVEKFIFVSSTEVYGEMEEISETITPEPDSINAYELVAGEKFCEYYHKKHGINTIIVRVPFVYGVDEVNSIVYHLATKSELQNEIILPVGDEQKGSFLHVLDVVDFIKRIINDIYRPEVNIVNLSSSWELSFSELTDLFNEFFPEVVYKFNDDRGVNTRPTPIESAKTIYDWIDIHDLRKDLPGIIEKIRFGKRKPESGLSGVINAIRDAPDTIKYLELGFGVILMQLLSEMTGTLIQFKYVDFRLLFVVIMGAVYGMRFGLYAAILASASILFTWYRLSFDWALLTHNVGNWFPFVIYFTAGLLIGYRRDKNEIEKEYEKKQTQLIYDKYSFLYDVFNDVRALKDEFHEQIIGYRESFGKVYSITEELDTLEEDKVFRNALNILQEVMANDSIAIYTIGKNQNFARLEVNSPRLTERLTKSLNLAAYPELSDSIKDGLIFQNIDLLDDYPAYLSPIKNGDTPVALVAIWECSYDQFSLEYYNLFRILCGLIQASLVRASMFFEANLDKMYLPATKVLHPDAFLEAVRIREDMKRNKIADYQLLRIDLAGKDYQEIYSQISNKVRSTDMIGAGQDGNCYVLLSQADIRSVNEIIQRIGVLSGKVELISPTEVVSI